MAGGSIQLDNGIKKERGNYGIRVARPGYDASSCSDSQLLFNSAWPIMQITRVVDFDKNGKEYYTYSRMDTTTWEIAETREEEPEGLGTKTMTQADEGMFRVGKKYCYKLLESGYAYDSDNTRWIVDKFKVVSHQLGFVPLWFKSEWVSDVSNKIVLTSIDIQTDIDYPYTDSPTAFLSSSIDYGIKSSSIFGSKVDGLSTGAFSKLVQRVMTTQKSGGITYDNDNVVVDRELIWYPVSNPDDLSEEEAKKLMTQYECYSFMSGVYNVYAYTKELSFEYRPVRVKEKYIQSSGTSYPIGFATMGQAADASEKVLVILRSPMVSPEYEEAII